MYCKINSFLGQLNVNSVSIFLKIICFNLFYPSHGILNSLESGSPPRQDKGQRHYKKAVNVNRCNKKFLNLPIVSCSAVFTASSCVVSAAMFWREDTVQP